MTVPSFDLSRYKAAVFDLDGTVWLSGRPIPGAREFVDRCRDQGLTVAFATNATAIPAEQLLESLLACGLGRPSDAVITGGSVVARTLVELGITEVVAEAPRAMLDAMASLGIAIADLTDDGHVPDDWSQPSPGRAVVMGASRGATFGRVERIGHLAAAGHTLYVTSLEPGYPALGRMEPGGGMLVAAVRVLYDVEPIVLGKPSRYYADVVRRTLATDGPIVMIGDSQRADIGTARFLGADGVLVTSKPLAADLPVPHYVAPSLADPIVAYTERAEVNR